MSPSGERVGAKAGSTVNWLLPDLHGSVAATLSSSESTVTSATRYDAWGGTVATGAAGGTAAGDKAWKYQGRLDVSPSGLSAPLYDAGARLYAPGTAAFTSLDTYAGSAQDPLSMNRWLYAEANPATLTDPTGHCPALLAWAGGPFAGALGTSVCVAGAVVAFATAVFASSAAVEYCAGGGPLTGPRCNLPSLSTAPGTSTYVAPTAALPASRRDEGWKDGVLDIKGPPFGPTPQTVPWTQRQVGLDPGGHVSRNNQPGGDQSPGGSPVMRCLRDPRCVAAVVGGTVAVVGLAKWEDEFGNVSAPGAGGPKPVPTHAPTPKPSPTVKPSPTPWRLPSSTGTTGRLDPFAL